jgi:hypothetical protein
MSCFESIKMEKTKYHTVGTTPKSITKIVERDKMDTTNTQIHDLIIPWLGTGKPIKQRWD